MSWSVLLIGRTNFVSEKLPEFQRLKVWIAGFRLWNNRETYMGVEKERAEISFFPRPVDHPMWCGFQKAIGHAV